MPTIPRRWPSELEGEREQAIATAANAIHSLQQAQTTIDAARAKLAVNQGLALMLIADTDRNVADTTTHAERVRRYLAVVKGKPIHGRWPMVALRQREDAESCIETACDLLLRAEQQLELVRTKIAQNPALAEAMIADIATLQARTLTHFERFIRILTEAGIGRD